MMQCRFQQFFHYLCFVVTGHTFAVFMCHDFLCLSTPVCGKE